MKCLRHQQTDANAICTYCGAALCADCAQRTQNHRIACSAECAVELMEADATLSAIRQKTLGGHRLTGYFCCGGGMVLAIFAVLAGLEKQWPVFILQLLLAVGLGASGYFYLRLSNHHQTN